MVMNSLAVVRIVEIFYSFISTLSMMISNSNILDDSNFTLDKVDYQNF